ncbi:MAG TPA: peptide-methionine (S)-S-oxide reductase MsrA [Tenuifilaceae bacterium]|nr:peptide-methionine (S)-S-oxide reductase MsrA [Tenuifilaceae bacterium]
MKWIAVLMITTAFLIGNACNGNKYEQKQLMTMDTKYEIAILGAGCFWCVEAIYSQVKGVVKVESGYSGGYVTNPTYKEVCTGNTGHAEVVQVTFDPDIISFAEILEIYFKTHNPTMLNRQGADVGTQYRSVIFYGSEKQKVVAEEIIERLSKAKIWNDPIVTAVEPYKNFYKAEDYHQDYYVNNKNQPYCRMVITPKLEKFKTIFKEYLKK